MIYLLLGKDDFSKKEFLDSLRLQNKAEFLEFSDPAARNLEREITAAANNAGLFGEKKVIRIEGLLSKINFEELFPKISESQSIVVFVEESLDKRKTETKNILKSKNLNVLEFEIPSNENFRNWVIARAKKYILKFSKNALAVFLARLG